MNIRELIESANKEKKKKERAIAAQNLAVGMGVVATLSVATGILFAPKSGKETRELIKKKAVDTAETVKEIIQKKSDLI